MAQGQIPVTDNRPKIVHCSDCRFFVRDTDGLSFVSGSNPKQYFMGECSKGLHPDTIKKQFADKPRICTHFCKQN